MSAMGCNVGSKCCILYVVNEKYCSMSGLGMDILINLVFREEFCGYSIQ